MKLYRQFDKLNWMRIRSNDPVLQAGLGFVAHATIADMVCHAGELAHVGSRSEHGQELKEQILSASAMTAK
jgi:NAD(P)H-dependent flavin oxidoreductase YrpB (nitropropane dioxygenase family)